ncbi:hypothetical protein [Kitasatospora sp. NPDC088783]|uniref:hypothetical protein n=1 Tax=Kitasatospora sp. NPDC088783 TaxID=3364077 RepID=UPI00380F0042
MNTSTDIRFAKNARLHSGWGRKHRRWTGVPLTLLTAAGLTACGPARHDGAAPAAARAAASAPVAGTAPDTAPVPAATATPTAPGATDATEPADPADPESDPGADGDSGWADGTGILAAAEKKGDGKLTISFDGLAGHRVQAGGEALTFTVTWRNGTDRSYQDLQPVVATRFYPGARCAVIAPTAEGTLQRQDPSGWTDLPLSQGTGTDYATTGKDARFTLDPGASRTLTYRMRLDAGDGPGTLPVEADAVHGDTTLVARALQDVEVTDPRRPAAAFDTAPADLPAPAPGQFHVTVKLTGSALPAARALAGLALFNAAGDGPQPSAADLKVEWLHGGAWAPVELVDACIGERLGVGLAPDYFPAALGAGESRSTTFRVTVAPGADPRLTRLLVVADGTADGHYATTEQHETELRRRG